METVEKNLGSSDWSLVAHPDYTVYSNENSFVVMSSDNEMEMKFSIKEDTVAIDSIGWATKIEIRSGRVIAITNDPTEEED